MYTDLIWIDKVIIGATLIISAAIGLYFRYTGGRQKTAEEFFVANRDMGVMTVAIGLMVSYLSAVSLLGVSAEIYNYGTHYVVIVLGYMLATPLIGYLYLPVFFKIGATSAFQYLEQRFGIATRIVASLAFLSQSLLYSGVVVYAPALALETTTGLSTTWSMVIITLVSTFYSTIGGIKAVLITDVFQAILMIISIIIIIVKGIVDVGGVDKIWKIADDGGRIDFGNISLDPTVRHTWWGLVIGGTFMYLSLYAVNQVQVQRMLTIRTIEGARKALWLTLPITIATVCGIAFSGLAVYSKYYNCDPFTTTKIKSIDQLLPYYIMENLSVYPGIPGLFIAGIFSASLSTISAVQNSVAAIVLEDYIKPIYRYRGKTISEGRSATISKILALVVGLVCLAVTFIVQQLGNLIQAALTIFGIVGGPLLGVYTLGMFTQLTNEAGAISGLIISLGTFLWIGFGKHEPPVTKLDVSGCNLSEIQNITTVTASPKNEEYFYLFRISYIWYSSLGFIICLIVGLCVTLITKWMWKTPDAQLNADLFTPFVANRIRKQRENQRQKSQRNHLNAYGNVQTTF